jgi:hypothetical protein
MFFQIAKSGSLGNFPSKPLKRLYLHEAEIVRLRNGETETAVQNRPNRYSCMKTVILHD